jgi:hypothetical protein
MFPIGPTCFRVVTDLFFQGYVFPPTRSSHVPARLRGQTNSFQSRGHMKLWLSYFNETSRMS